MFQFKQFTIHQQRCAMKVGTDGVLLGAWASGGRRVLDIGTGTGLIALMMSQRFAEAMVMAVDIDEEAVLQARENVLASPFSGRIEVLGEAVQTLAQKEPLQGAFDSIVSNPPFFIDSLNAPDAQRNVARHADTLSYSELMEAAWLLLGEEGELSVVVPFDYRRRMEDEAIFRGFFQSRVCAVKTKADKPVKRFLLAFRKHPCQCVSETMTVGDDCYRQLTQDFYL